MTNFVFRRAQPTQSPDGAGGPRQQTPIRTSSDGMKNVGGHKGNGQTSEPYPQLAQIRNCLHNEPELITSVISFALSSHAMLTA